MPTLDAPPESKLEASASNARTIIPERMSKASNSVDPEAHTRRIVLITHTGFLLVGIANTLIGPILPLLSSRWHLSDAQAGNLFTAQFAGAIAGSAFSGLLIRKLQVMTVLAAGYAGLAIAIISLSANSWMIGMASFVLLGFSLGLTNPATNMLIAELNPERRGAALNLLNLMWGVGAISGPTLIALLTPGGDVIWVLSALTVALAAVALTLTRSATRLSFVQTRTSPFPISSMLSACLSPYGLLTGALVFIYVGTETAISGWIAAYVQRLGQTSQAFWALASSIFWAGLLSGRAFAPIVLRRINEERLMLFALSLAIAGMSTVLMGQGLIVISLGAALTGIGLAPIFPTTLAIFTRYYGAQSSQLAGVLFVLASLGGAVLPGLVGSVSSHYSELRVGLIVPLVGGAVMLALQFAINTFVTGVKQLPDSK